MRGGLGMNRKLISAVLIVSMLFSLWGEVAGRHSSALAAPIEDASYEWGNVPIGGGGFVTGMAIHPTEKDLMYVRTDVGGAFRWDAAQQSWKQLLTFLGPDEVNQYAVDGIALSKTNPELVYAALGGLAWGIGSDIYKSTDRGETWSKTNLNKMNLGGDQVTPDGNERVIGESLAVDPNNEDVVYAGTRSDGLWVSQDGAATWTQVPTASLPNGSPNRGIRNVLFDESSAVIDGKTSVLYVGVQGEGIYKSDDAGSTWTLMSDSPIKPKRLKLNKNGDLYVVAGGTQWGGNPVIDENDGIFVFRDGTWSNITPVSGKSYGAIGVDSNSDFLVTNEFLSKTFYVSKDGGVTWKNATQDFVQNRTVPWWHDYHFNTLTCQIEFDPHSSSVWFVGGFGIWETKDIHAPKVDWYTRVDGVEETVIFDLVSTSQAKLIAAVGDINGFTFDNIHQYPTHTFSEPRMGESISVDFSEEDPNFVARNGGSNWGGGTGSGGYSTDGGHNWNTFESWPFGNGGKIALSADIKENGKPVIVFMPLNDVPYRSTDLGATWTKAKAPASQAMRNFWEYRGDVMVSDRNDGNKFYLYDKYTGKLYRSDDAGQQWSEVNPSLPVAGQWTWVNISTVKGMPGYVWVSTDTEGGGAYVSNDYGNTFTPVSNVQRIRNFAYGKGAPGSDLPALYIRGIVNQSEGFFRSDDGGATWIQINDAAHKYGVEVSSMIGDPEVFGKIYLATSNIGIVYGQIAGTDDAPPVVTLDQASTSSETDASHAVRDSNYTITGRLSEPGLVHINGSEVPVDAQTFAFSHSTILKEGMNDFVITAMDAAVDSEGKPRPNESQPTELHINHDPDYVGITTDLADQHVNDPQLEVTGTTNVEGQVLINGKAVAVTGSRTFSHRVELADGKNDIQLQAQDQEGHSSITYTKRVYYDTAAPVIDIPEVLTAEDSNYVLSGTVNEPAVITINGQDTQVSESLAFSSFQKLAEGDNEFVITATDRAGNVGTKTITVTYTEDSEPEIVGEGTARLTESPVTIDGELDEGMWKLSHTLTKLDEGVNNNAVKFGTLWDHEYLYVAAKIFDNNLHRDSDDYYQDDSIEVFIDADNSKDGAYGSDSRQIFIGYDRSEPLTWQKKDGIISAVKLINGGYSVEAAIPWSNLAIVPRANMTIGFDMANNDDDNGAARDGVLIWNGNGSNWQNNTNFGTLILDGVMPPRQVRTLDDPANNFDLVYRHTDNLYIATWSPEVLGEGRFSKSHTYADQEYAVVYKSPSGDITGFNLLASRGIAYTKGDYKMYISKDDSSYTEIIPTKTIDGYPGNQELALYSASQLEPGARYVKFVFPEQVNPEVHDEGWATHILNVDFTYEMLDQDIVAEDKKTLEIGYASGENADGVTQGVTLAASGSNGSSITWSSSHPAVISNAGAVTRPKYGQPDVQVTLTATLAKGTATDSKTFTVTVKAITTAPADPQVPDTTPMPPKDDTKVIVNDPQVKDGKLAVEIAQGTRQVFIPIKAAVAKGVPLEVKASDVAVSIPPEVILELQGLLEDADPGDAQLFFKVERLKTDAIEALLHKASDKESADVRAAGELYEFSLGIVNKNGQERKLSSFTKPITVSLLIDHAANMERIGIYSIRDDGAVEYKGGRIAGDKIAVELDHFSKYGVLEYNKKFADIQPGYWAEAVIADMAAKHIINGISDTEFAPARSVTRAEFTAMLVRALGLGTGDKVSSFIDVERGDWYAEEVAAAEEAGLLKGKADQRFAPGDTITREEMAVLIVRAYEHKTGKPIHAQSHADFVDRSDVSEWAKPAVDAAYERGLLQGKRNHQFDPKGAQLRSETAQVIWRLLQAE